MICMFGSATDSEPQHCCYVALSHGKGIYPQLPYSANPETTVECLFVWYICARKLINTGNKYGGSTATDFVYCCRIGSVPFSSFKTPTPCVQMLPQPFERLRHPKLRQPCLCNINMTSEPVPSPAAVGTRKHRQEDYPPNLPLDARTSFTRWHGRQEEGTRLATAPAQL